MAYGDEARKALTVTRASWLWDGDVREPMVLPKADASMLERPWVSRARAGGSGYGGECVRRQPRALHLMDLQDREICPIALLNLVHPHLFQQKVPFERRKEVSIVVYQRILTRKLRHHSGLVTRLDKHQRARWCGTIQH